MTQAQALREEPWVWRGLRIATCLILESGQPEARLGPRPGPVALGPAQGALALPPRRAVATGPAWLAEALATALTAQFLGWYPGDSEGTRHRAQQPSAWSERSRCARRRQRLVGPGRHAGVLLRCS